MSRVYQGSQYWSLLTEGGLNDMPESVSYNFVDNSGRKHTCEKAIKFTQNEIGVWDENYTIEFMEFAKKHSIRIS